MGLFKILGFAALGVGAVAAAPFTGGGSLLGAASLAGSLAGAGTIATTAGVAGAVVGAVSTALDSDETIQEANRARKEGYEMGFKEAEVETKKKFLELLKENDNLRLGGLHYHYMLPNWMVWTIVKWNIFRKKLADQMAQRMQNSVIDSSQFGKMKCHFQILKNGF